MSNLDSDIEVSPDSDQGEATTSDVSPSDSPIYCSDEEIISAYHKDERSEADDSDELAEVQLHQDLFSSNVASVELLNHDQSDSSSAYPIYCSEEELVSAFYKDVSREGETLDPNTDSDELAQAPREEEEAPISDVSSSESPIYCSDEEIICAHHKDAGCPDGESMEMAEAQIHQDNNDVFLEGDPNSDNDLLPQAPPEGEEASGSQGDPQAQYQDHDWMKFSQLQRENLNLKQQLAAAQRESQRCQDLQQKHVALSSEVEEKEEERIKAETKLKLAEGRITDLKQEQTQLNVTLRGLNLKLSEDYPGQHWFKPPDFVCPRLEMSGQLCNSYLCQLQDGWMINTPRPDPTPDTQRLREYSGTCSSSPLPPPPAPPVYYEVGTRVEVTEEIRDWHILELGLAAGGDRDRKPWVCGPRLSSSCCWGVKVTPCFDHPGRVCARGWKRGVRHTGCYPTPLTYTPGAVAELKYAVIVDQHRKMAAFIDVDTDLAVMAAFRDVDLREKEANGLWAMFGAEPKAWSGCRVKIRLISGSEIAMTDAKKSAIENALSS